MTQILIGITHRLNNEITLTLEFRNENHGYDVEIPLEKAREMLSSLELSINSADRIQKDNEELMRLREKFKDTL